MISDICCKKFYLVKVSVVGPDCLIYWRIASLPVIITIIVILGIVINIIIVIIILLLIIVLPLFWMVPDNVYDPTRRVEGL